VLKCLGPMLCKPQAIQSHPCTSPLTSSISGSFHPPGPANLAKPAAPLSRQRSTLSHDGAMSASVRQLLPTDLAQCHGPATPHSHMLKLQLQKQGSNTHREVQIDVSMYVQLLPTDLAQCQGAATPHSHMPQLQVRKQGSNTHIAVQVNISIYAPYVANRPGSTPGGGHTPITHADAEQGSSTAAVPAMVICKKNACCRTAWLLRHTRTC
jgi:hypothetical protein